MIHPLTAKLKRDAKRGKPMSADTLKAWRASREWEQTEMVEWLRPTLVSLSGYRKWEQGVCPIPNWLPEILILRCSPCKTCGSTADEPT